ncbi:alpha-1,2-fucosyltransferase [Tessaracoccus palaemonis]|uniref:Alpha-1,2-fucosyltransferase n=1 Tax=Tessaracoccus palaemonis TaxID=2829499 RepID=A0ABX8SLC5_9ACTN|nr:alpha-1,2-fucosyltransferase [Tessaracoccus palaemonis]QXT62958.1 alpha-1,2-fucosyltransferase [Tessaracoccus palaemonis]
MEGWLRHFPRLGELVIQPDRMRLSYAREVSMYQGSPDDDRATLEHFIREYLLSAPALAAPPADDRAQLTVNVRRGDYYSDPRWRPLYAFDVASYVREAVAGALRQGAVDNISIVSDDPAWCRTNLGFLQETAPIHLQDPADGPADNFIQLCRARRLILANSSFSYWAAYISNVRHGDNYELTWAPWFHRRDLLGGRAWHLDSRWSVVTDIPGGW